MVEGVINVEWGVTSLDLIKLTNAREVTRVQMFGKIALQYFKFELNFTSRCRDTAELTSSSCHQCFCSVVMSTTVASDMGC